MIADLFNEAQYQAAGEQFDRRTFESKSLEVARALSDDDIQLRIDRARLTREQVQFSPNLHLKERESYERFAQGLELDTQLNVRLLQDRLLRCLIGIRDAASPLSPCAAVVIEAAQSTDEGAQTILADTILENNDIIGAVSFYGVPGKTQLNLNHLGRLGTLIKREDNTGITILGAAGTLHVLNNKLTRLVVAEAMVRQIQRIPEGGQIVGVYGRSFITNNVIDGGGNLLLAYHQSLNSNAFNLGGGREELDATHKVIGDSVILIGNYAPRPDILWNVSRVNQKSANLTLAITDL